MADDLTISAGKPDQPGMDYSLLMEEGLAHIRDLAGEIWTDHNTHDPGITILETLCYAITDLSYRCNFSVEDLLASDPGNRSGNSADFRLAHEVLPMRPYTINDYRKLLADLPGIRNAWIEKAGSRDKTTGQEQAISYDQAQNQLVYGETDNPIYLTGLYEVKVELSEDPELGDLNANSIIIPLNINGIPMKADLVFPHISLINKAWQKQVAIDSVNVTIAASNQESYDLVAHTNVKINGKPANEHFDLKIRIQGDQENWKTALNEVKAAIANRILDKSSSGLFTLFNRRIFTIANQLRLVEEVLHQNRNLCEDFLRVDLIRTQEITIAGELEIALDASAEDLLAAVYFDMHKFIDPPIRFYSLKEMLSDYSTEEIFEGPLLKHGFIRDSNLQAFKSREGIFTSDLIQLIMDSAGGQVKAVKGLRISNYIDSTLISPGIANCLKLFEPAVYKPKLDVWRSGLRCRKNGIDVSINKELVLEKFRELVKASEPDKTAMAGVNLEISAGRDRKTGSYFSIQEQLPLTYGTGSSGLPEESSAKRRGQARQLKGYLLLFDQLLANFLAQLSNLKNLFSIDPLAGKTFFAQAVYGVPDSMYLLKEFIGPQASLSDPETIRTAWELFKADPSNAYVTALKTMQEDQKTFLERRNRFLDHLMARFCEEFTDYSLLMLARHNQLVPPALIDQKVAFLQEYPALAGERGQGFVISGPAAEPWDTPNVPGMKKRVAGLLGMSNYNRRSLAHPAFRFVSLTRETGTNGIDEYRFIIYDQSSGVILKSPQATKELAKAVTVVYKVLDLGLSADNFKVSQSDGGKFSFKLLDANDQTVGLSAGPFATEALALEEIARITAFMQSQFSNISLVPEDGFHVIEHLLLRPRTNEGSGANKIQDPLWPVIPDDFGNQVAEGRDPYSFRVTIAFPAECESLSDAHFRGLAERIARLETPAHVMPHICFLDNIQLCHLEMAWKDWLELRVLPVPEGVTARRNHLKALRNALQDLRSVMQFLPLTTQT